MASESLARLSGLEISDRRIRRQVHAIGETRVNERDEAIEKLKSMPLPARRIGKPHEARPEVAVVMMDGGRYQRRDHFGTAVADEGSSKTHWRESKVGCLLSMSSEVSEQDPCPMIPSEFAQASVVREIAQTTEKTCDFREKETQCDNHSKSTYKSPGLLSKEVVASGKSAEEFGFHLESRAYSLNFPRAKRKAFVADGLRANWTIQEKHFPESVEIADIIHVLSYLWNAAEATEQEGKYQSWAQLIWQGDVHEVIKELHHLSDILGPPDKDTSPSDPRSRIARALTYLTNNAHRMAYHHYRQQGLPLTSAHIESTIKQVNRRIKGTEKFWLESSSECVLQLRADSISDSQPLDSFWTRCHANQQGSNTYQSAS